MIKILFAEIQLSTKCLFGVQLLANQACIHWCDSIYKPFDEDRKYRWMILFFYYSALIENIEDVTIRPLYYQL